MKTNNSNCQEQNKKRAIQHQELAAGRWRQWSFLGHTANIDSEAERGASLMKHRWLRLMCVFIVMAIFCSPNLYAQENEIMNRDTGASSAAVFQNSLAIRPIDLFVSIYVLQYEKQIDLRNEMILGIYFLETTAASAYPGSYRLYSVMLGYRRYLWEGLHVESVLLPGYARYIDAVEGGKYESYEVGGEVHFGYQFEFEMLTLPVFITPQVLFGFSLYKSNEPASFKAIDDDPKYCFPYKYYVFPNINIGFRF